MFFGIIAVVLIATAGAVVDFTHVQQARVQAQTALDATVLALHRRLGEFTDEEIRVQAASVLTQTIGDTEVGSGVTAVARIDEEGMLRLTGYVETPTIFVQLVGIKSLRAQLVAEARGKLQNVEVAAALDVSDSMIGSKLAALKRATRSLVDIVVQDNQNSVKTRVAIIPWATSVHAEPIDQIRPKLRGYWGINSTNINYGDVEVTCITQAKPAVVTMKSTKDLKPNLGVHFSSAGSMTQIANKFVKITRVVDSTTIELDLDTSAYSAFKCNEETGHVSICLIYECTPMFTVYWSELRKEEFVKMWRNKERTLNGIFPVVAKMDPHGWSGDIFFSVPVTPWQMDDYNRLIGTGVAECMSYGCTRYYYKSSLGTPDNPVRVDGQATNCPSERLANALTNAPPTTEKFGYHYSTRAAAVTWCWSSPAIQPLTSNKTKLKQTIDAMTTDWGTAGHIGVAWGWYTLSESFNYLWPAASAAAPGGSANTLKALILMSDGKFNYEYCNGVLSNDGPPHSQRIDCPSPEGNSATQAQKICANIKKPENGITLYTIGFDIADSSDAQATLANCATSPSHFFLAQNEAELVAAFEAIARALSPPRLSQ